MRRNSILALVLYIIFAGSLIYATYIVTQHIMTTTPNVATSSSAGSWILSNAMCELWMRMKGILALFLWLVCTLSVCWLGYAVYTALR